MAPGSRWTFTTTTTFSPRASENGVHAESLDKERQIGRAQRETFRTAVHAGVQMIFGTDNGGVFPAGQNALQFAKRSSGA